MNESRFKHFWLYVIDMHNHHSVGDLRFVHTLVFLLNSYYFFCRHAVNPTSPFRMELILKAAMAEKAAASAAGASSAAAAASQAAAASGVEKTAGDDLADQLMAMNIESNSEVWCKCTRKCKTKMCPCLSSGVPCSVKCHPRNNSCTNS